MPAWRTHVYKYTLSGKTPQSQHGDGTWRVQYQGHQQSGFASLKQAKDHLRSLLVAKGVILADGELPLRAKYRRREQTPSNYLGVSFDKVAQRWRGTAIAVGAHDSAAGAAQAIRSAMAKRPASDCVNSPHGEAIEREQEVPIQDLIVRMQHLVRWNELPEDLVFARRHTDLSRSIYEVEPATHMSSLQLEYHPVRSALQDIASQRLHTQPATGSSATRAAVADIKFVIYRLLEWDTTPSATYFCQAHA